MNFVNPSALALAALALPVVALYILKVRLRRVPVSTLMFWQKVFEEKKPRSLWQRLRHWVSLALQLAFLALLVLAVADPIFRWQQARSRRVVLVLDNSASMSAAEGGRTRLAEAKAEAGRVIDGLRVGDELAVISAGTPARVRCGLTEHQRTLREAVEAVGETDGPTQVAEAVALARRLLSGTEHVRKVIVLSDGCFEGAAALSKEADVELVALGSKRPNLGITRLQARRSLLDPVGYEILAEVLNASDEPATCRLELDLDDEPIDVVPLTLKPGESVTQVFEKTSAEGGRLRARLDREDALMADNSAYALLPRRERQRLALVTAGDLFLEKVFEAMPLVDLAVAKIKPEEAVPSPSLAGTGPPAVTVYHRRLPKTLPPGPVVVIEPTESSALWTVGETLLNPVVAKQDGDSPLMTHVRLDRVLMPEARKLTPLAPAAVLAEAAGGEPLLLSFDRPEGLGRVLVLTVNLDRSDLPLQTAFPILMTNALAWFSGGKGELRESVGSGSVAQVSLPAEVRAALKAAPGSELRLRSPEGTEQPLPLSQDADKAVVGPFDRAGLWGISVAAPGAKPGESKPLMEVACNLASSRESDLRPAAGQPTRPQGLSSSLGSRPLWYYLLACAWGVTCWEWFLYQRRWID
ncbi:MAG: VWA domain-containing protein [Isosphaeraceae bacterium]